MLFAAGIGFILQPWWSERMQEKQQSKLLAHWDQYRHASEQNNDAPHSLPTIRSPSQPSSDSTDPAPPAQAFAESEAAGVPEAAVSAAVREPEPKGSPAIIDGMAVHGTISIESLDLREPILEGATEETLRYGIGIVETDRRPGETGNFVLAGHNSRTPGKHFNRIHELKTDDKIVIATADSAYLYAVTAKFVVEPDDLSVLAQNADAAELTLITCDQIVNPTHRLIVKARLKSEMPSQVRKDEGKRKT
ncbi:class D sortase [Paenibacillus hamazuiensis]|uniref:class D sortase n=1 Tax=Paenibacillus hamazuiensis TaxID=2936508 RepID=UPI00200C7B0D|nr:class D sortase [Paenibacillus hamazuiensis]